MERRESTLSTRKQIGASRENGHWWRGKHYASVGKKDIESEDGWYGAGKIRKVAKRARRRPRANSEEQHQCDRVRRAHSFLNAE